MLCTRGSLTIACTKPGSLLFCFLDFIQTEKRYGQDPGDSYDVTTFQIGEAGHFEEGG